MAISDKTVQALKASPGQRITKEHDRDGLFIHVTQSNTKNLGTPLPHSR